MVGCLGILLGVCGTAHATSYHFPVTIDLYEADIGTYPGVPGNEYWYVYGYWGTVTNLNVGDDVTTAFDFSNGEMLELSDPTSLAMESVHWLVRSASTDDFTVNFVVTLSGPSGGPIVVTANNVASGALNSAGYDWIQEYLDPEGGDFLVDQIDAYFEVVDVQFSGQMKYESFQIGLDARSVSIVPEPGSAGLLLLGLGAVIRRRRGRAPARIK